MSEPAARSNPAGSEPTDPVDAARRTEREVDRLVRSGRLDTDTLRELEIAIDQLHADLTNGEHPDASLGRIQRLIDRSQHR